MFNLALTAWRSWKASRNVRSIELFQICHSALKLYKNVEKENSYSERKPWFACKVPLFRRHQASSAARQFAEAHALYFSAFDPSSDDDVLAMDPGWLHWCLTCFRAKICLHVQFIKRHLSWLVGINAFIKRHLSWSSLTLLGKNRTEQNGLT